MATYILGVLYSRSPGYNKALQGLWGPGCSGCNLMEKEVIAGFATNGQDLVEINVMVTQAAA